MNKAPDDLRKMRQALDHIERAQSWVDDCIKLIANRNDEPINRQWDGIRKLSKALRALQLLESAANAAKDYARFHNGFDAYTYDD